MADASRQKAVAVAAAAAATPALTEPPHYVHKRPVPMMPLGNAFLFVWSLENLQERQLAQLEGHDQQLLAFLCDAVTQRKRKPDSDPSVIRIQLKRPRSQARPWSAASGLRRLQE